MFNKKTFINTINIFVSKEEQTRIGIDPKDVKHKREPIQILCRILEEYGNLLEK